MSKVLITGSNGFVGHYLASYLQKHEYDIVYTFRDIPEYAQCIQPSFAIGNIDSNTQWQPALENVNTVVHLAARVHVMKETLTDPLSEFRKVNTEGTLNLARQALEAGVKRFVYLSSIKVNGEYTDAVPFSADDPPHPQDPYAISKYEAEQLLLELGHKTDLEIVIIRPPLIYGPGVKGNFRRLINLIKKNIPLPLAGIYNARSLVSIQNLCSLIEVCLYHPHAANEIFLVSDGNDLSTSELLEQLTEVMKKKNHLFYVPVFLVKIVTNLLGRSSEFERLFGSLQVDISKNKQLLNWQPLESVQTALGKCI